MATATKTPIKRSHVRKAATKHRKATEVVSRPSDDAIQNLLDSLAGSGADDDTLGLCGDDFDPGMFDDPDDVI